jgi:putative membrane protein
MLTPADHDRIHTAIAEAEARTSGEIFCVIARESGAYREVQLAAAAGVALLLPPLALLLGLRPGLVFGWLQGGWTVAHASAVSGATLYAVIGYAGLQAALFIAVLALTWIAPLRRLITPAYLKRSHVHARAMEQFAHRLHGARADAYVLIYVSAAERRVEIVADDEIHAKVGQAPWDRAVQAALGPIRAGDPAAGLIAAIHICGDALAEHFPAGGTTGAPENEDVAQV